MLEISSQNNASQNQSFGLKVELRLMLSSTFHTTFRIMFGSSTSHDRVKIRGPLGNERRNREGAGKKDLSYIWPLGLCLLDEWQGRYRHHSSEVPRHSPVAPKCGHLNRDERIVLAKSTTTSFL
jgi:hypothetical protein